MVEAGLRVTSVDASEELCDWTRAAPGARRTGRQPGRCRGDLAAPATCRTPPSTRRSARRCWSTSTTTRPPPAELRRVLRPGGLLVVTVPANPYRYDWTDHWAGHRRRYTVPRRSRACCEDAGLHVGRGRRVGLPADRALPPPGLPPRPAPPPRGRRGPATGRAARPPGWPRGWCGPPSRSTRRSSAAAPATTACVAVARRGDRRPTEAVGRPRAGRRGGAGAASPPGVLVLGFLGWALVDGWSSGRREYDWDLEPVVLSLGVRRDRRSSTWRAASATARSWTACTAARPAAAA